MIVALAFVCMTLAVLESSNVPPNSTESDDPIDFNISSTVGNLFTTISLNSEILDHLSSHKEEAEDPGCDTCNSTERHIPSKMPSPSRNTATKIPAPTRIAETNDSTSGRMNRVSGGTKKSTATTETTSTTEDEMVSSQIGTDWLNTTKFDETTNTVVAHVMSSLRKFLNNTESTTKTFHTTTNSPSSLLGKISISTKVMTFMAPPVTFRSLLAKSTVSTTQASSGMPAVAVTLLGPQLSAVAKSNDSRMTPLETTNALSQRPTTNALGTATDVGNVLTLKKTTKMASHVTTLVTMNKTSAVTPEGINIPIRVRTTGRTTKIIVGRANAGPVTVKTCDTNGGTKKHIRERVTGKTNKTVRERTTVTTKVMDGKTPEETKLPHGRTGGTTHSAHLARKITPKIVHGKKASRPSKGVSEMAYSASTVEKKASDILAQVLVILDTTTNVSVTTTALGSVIDTTSTVGLSTTSNISAGLSHALNTISGTASSGITPSSTSTKTLDRKGSPSDSDTSGSTTSECADDDDESTSPEESEDSPETTTEFTGPSIWSTNWPHDSTTEEKETELSETTTNEVSPLDQTSEATLNTDQVSPRDKTFQTTTLKTKKVSSLNEIVETILNSKDFSPKTTTTESEEKAPPARHATTTEGATSLETRSGNTGGSNTKGKVHLLPKAFMIHSLDRSTASGGRTHRAATTHRRHEEKKTDSRRTRHDKKKGSPSPAPSKKQRKSLFRKAKNSETTPITS